MVYAMYVADSLVDYLETLGGINMHNLVLDKPYQRTLKPDADLESLMNLIWPLRKKPNFLTKAYPDHDSTAVRPILLTIGDSYYWNILNFIPVWDIFNGVPYWYYFSTAYFDGDENRVSEKNLVKKLVSVDFVMLAYGTTQLYRMSNGFSEKALLELCYDEEEIQTGKSLARKAFENDAEARVRAEKRAKRENDPLDVAMDDEFEDWMKLHLEDFFPELRDSIPTKRSTKMLELTK